MQNLSRANRVCLSVPAHTHSHWMKNNRIYAIRIKTQKYCAQPTGQHPIVEMFKYAHGDCGRARALICRHGKHRDQHDCLLRRTISLPIQLLRFNTCRNWQQQQRVFDALRACTGAIARVHYKEKEREREKEFHFTYYCSGTHATQQITSVASIKASFPCVRFWLTQKFNNITSRLSHFSMWPFVTLNKKKLDWTIWHECN